MSKRAKSECSRIPVEAVKPNRKVLKKGAKLASSNNYPPNDKDRREKTRDKGQCQRCGKKQSLPTQYRVAIKGDKVVKEKGAKPDQSHYCAECADKRVGEQKRYLAARDGQPAKKRGRPAKASKAKAKTTGRKRGAHQTKAKAKPARKRTVKAKGRGKSKAKASSAEPF